jgi:putative transposase
MMGKMLESALDGELEEQLGYSKYDYRNKSIGNSRNGYSKKTLKSSSEEIDINVPRDQNNEFEPQIIRKHQSSISQDFEGKVTPLFIKVLH